jgi:ribosomal-protein-alanine N-acetyltransferase
VLRPLSMADVPALTRVLRENRQGLAGSGPLRPDEYFTVAGQEAAVATSLAARDAGQGHPMLVVGQGAGEVLGSLSLNSIIRGAFQSASLGYWVAEHAQGQGIASWAVSEARRVAFGELDLHRLQGETLVHNVASRRVLTKNGFVLYGLAPDYLRIAGRWQEHALYQLIRPAAA